MIQSMTGYGEAILDLPYKKIRIEIKSLNSKQWNLNMCLPSIYREKEMDIRQFLFQNIERGKVEVILTEISNIQVFPKIHSEVFENYFHQIKNLMKKLKIPCSSECVTALISLPKVIDVQASIKLEETEWKILKQTFMKAIKSFSSFRLQEGIMMEIILRKKIQVIASLLKEINQYELERIEKIKTRLSKVIQKIQIEDYSKNRLEQELLYYIEKLDIQEEKSRLKHHLDYFLKTIEIGKNQGRKLGFIVQEISREITTLGVKSNHLEIQKRIVQMKDELEQIREQILNVL